MEQEARFKEPEDLIELKGEKVDEEISDIEYDTANILFDKLIYYLIFVAILSFMAFLSIIGNNPQFISEFNNASLYSFNNAANITLLQFEKMASSKYLFGMMEGKTFWSVTFAVGMMYVIYLFCWVYIYNKIKIILIFFKDLKKSKIEEKLKGGERKL